MQYQKYNFFYNFSAAAATDTRATWDIVVHEINCQVLEHKAKLLALVTKYNKSAGNFSDVQLATAALNLFFSSGAFRADFLKAVAARQIDPYLTAGQGIYDIPLADTIGPGQALADANELAEDDEFTREQVTELLVADLTAKKKIRGISRSMGDRFRGASPFAIAVTTFAITVALGYAYKLYTNRQQ